MLMKPILTGESSFKNVRERDGVYVDKTEQIYKIFQNPGYYFLSRPRRFGKSLLCSTVASLFRGEKELFEGLWIENHWDFSQVHPVIHLDMTKAIAGGSSLQSITKSLALHLMSVAHFYSLTPPQDITAPGDILNWLIETLHRQTKKQVVVIIDEYDKPLLDTVHDGERFAEIQSLLRSVYSQLKALAEHLHLVFLTGICKFTKTSIFSGLNNILDISLSPESAELVGFTEEEIQTHFADYIAELAKKTNMHVSDVLPELRKNYNGYTFSIDLVTGPVGSVYNPFAINNVFAARAFVRRWFASGNPAILIPLLKKHNFSGIAPASLAIPLSKLEVASNFAELKPLPLLYYSGYLTIKDFEVRTQTLTLGFPNNEIAQCLTETLLPVLMATEDESLFMPYINQLRLAVEDEHFDEVKDILNQILSHVAYAMMEHRERYYQTILFLLLNIAHLRTQGEVLHNLGRSDLEILLGDKVIVIELKVGSSADKALAQAKDRGYANKHLSSGKKVFLMGIAVGQTRRDIEELVVEQLQ
jgi:hypothetical protein